MERDNIVFVLVTESYQNANTHGSDRSRINNFTLNSLQDLIKYTHFLVLPCEHYTVHKNNDVRLLLTYFVKLMS